MPIKCRGWKGAISNTDKVRKCANFAIAHKTVGYKSKTSYLVICMILSLRVEWHRNTCGFNLWSQPYVFLCHSTLCNNIIQITTLRLFCFNIPWCISLEIKQYNTITDTCKMVWYLNDTNTNTVKLNVNIFYSVKDLKTIPFLGIKCCHTVDVFLYPVQDP